jgi:hypothetical protein
MDPAAAAAAAKAALKAQIEPLSPRARTVRYYAQLDELRSRYAKDLQELHALLASQRLTPANKERIHSYQKKTGDVSAARWL